MVGIVNLDGAPVDRELLRSMVEYMAPRGPDAQSIWVDRNVGFGHAMLRTTDEAAGETQPLTLDGRTWITADCRVDGRSDLLRELGTRGCAPAPNAPDPELILHSYNVWGESCVDHLLGDFSFGIWDSSNRRLFCARDHFGVKAFFYARAGNALIFSNTLNCLRVHPSLSTELDEVAVADFLVFTQPLEAHRSVFSAVHRLLPAHTMTGANESITIRRYWEMPLEEEIRYKRRGQYIEHFRELMDDAVRDRLRTRTAGAFMSGGLDSPTVAATAKKLLAASSEPFDLQAHCVVFDRLIPDQERRYSGLVAEHLGIPINYFASDDTRFPPSEPERHWYPPEPQSLLDRGRTIKVHKRAAEMSRVLLRGDGADPLIEMPGSSLEGVLKQRHYGRLAADVAWLWIKRKRVPRIGVRTVIRKLRGHVGPVEIQPFPNWFSRDLAERHHLRERWEAQANANLIHPGFEIALPHWTFSLEMLDPGSMQLPAEMRFPFFDVRLVRYLLRVPPVPWAVEKAMIRVGMRGELPKEVLQRPKTSLRGNPWAKLLPPSSTMWWNEYLNSHWGLNRFVDIDAARATFESAAAKLERETHHSDVDTLRSAESPIGLNLWLEHNYLAKFSKPLQRRSNNE